MNELLDAVTNRFTETFVIANAGHRFADLLISVAAAAITFSIFYAGWRILQAAVGIVLRHRKVDRTTESFIRTVLKYGVLTVGAAQTMTILGVNTAAILTSLGVAGLTLGFAAQDTLSNIISGLLIFWDRPFVIGDLVEVGEFYGKVDRITLRSTRVVTVDGRMLAVPNSVMVNTTVASYTNFPHLRIDVSVTVGVGEDLDRARKILLGLVADDTDYMQDPEPKVVVRALNDYNVELQLQAWITDERAHVAKRFELRERVFQALTEAGVEMPFETLELVTETPERPAA